MSPLKKGKETKVDMEHGCKFANDTDCMCSACQSMRKALEEMDKIDIEKVFAEAEKELAELEKEIDIEKEIAELEKEFPEICRKK